MSSPTIQRPIPRRPFDLSDDAPDFPSDSHDFNSIPATPTLEAPPKRTKSTLALTSSTLFGIYGDDLSQSQTPFQLSRNPSMANFQRESLRAREEADSRRHHPQQSSGALALRLASLFAFGVAYGIVITHLHDRSPISPTKAAGVVFDIDRWSTRYLVFWGFAGVGLGSLLPWLDGKEGVAGTQSTKWDWTPAVRSIGAFIGIAYAIRRLPWQSTLQVSLALALVNPFLWFVVDRTRSGFWFASLVGVAGTAFLLQTSPEIIRTPDRLRTMSGQGELVGGVVLLETVAVGTWICSVLFCSCVCFGNIGRKLAVKERQRD